MLRFFFALSLLLASLAGQAQSEGLVNRDTIYVDYVKTVQFYLENLVATMPIISLSSPGQVVLTFDDLDAEVADYTYTIQHCNADWTPSRISELEYLSGFSRADIRTRELSFNTVVPYVHYTLPLPNQDMQFRLSGNYLLHVFNEFDEPVITRRFVVVEPLFRVEGLVNKAALVTRLDTYQEVDFTVIHEEFEIQNPLREISATVIQNGNWRTAIQGLSPNMIKPEQLIFDYQNVISFPAGKEYRPLDMRSLRTYAGNVREIIQTDEGYDVTLGRDQKRASSAYLTFEDLDGNFVIESFDFPSPDLRGDYANVLFNLYSPTNYEEEDVYVYGGLSDWQLRPEFKMVYNPVVNGYVAEVLLKQGYYDYEYVTVNRRTGEISRRMTEGNWFETNNTYTVLIYYRPFGQRYDRLLGAYTLLRNR